jgi:hypothetical protein
MTPNENLFNNMIWDLSLQEIPLLDHVFTWSNMQNPPILSKLDRILINADWNDSLPNSVASTLPRTTSDHFPLKIEVSTNIRGLRFLDIVTTGLLTQVLRIWSLQYGLAPLSKVMP